MEFAVPAAHGRGGRGNGPVVTASELTRRYGEGETAVDALRGVSLEIQPGQLTAIMGPSGSGKSTLMHILAALDRPTGGYVTIAGTRLGQLSDNEVTRIRRKHIGFVFQFFNLLPMLTRGGERPPAADDRRAEAGPRRLHGADEARRPRRPAHAPALRALGRPAAARRDRARARLEADRRLRGRADRQPRLQDGRRDPRAAAGVRARLRPDDGDGHARGAGGRDRRPRAVPRRRADRQGARRARTSTTSSRRWRRSALDARRAQGAPRAGSSAQR